MMVQLHSNLILDGMYDSWDLSLHLFPHIPTDGTTMHWTNQTMTGEKLSSGKFSLKDYHLNLGKFLSPSVQFTQLLKWDEMWCEVESALVGWCSRLTYSYFWLKVQKSIKMTNYSKQQRASASAGGRGRLQLLAAAVHSSCCCLLSSSSCCYCAMVRRWGMGQTTLHFLPC